MGWCGLDWIYGVSCVVSDSRYLQFSRNTSTENSSIPSQKDKIYTTLKSSNYSQLTTVYVRNVDNSRTYLKEEKSSPLTVTNQTFTSGWNVKTLGEVERFYTHTSIYTYHIRTSYILHTYITHIYILHKHTYTCIYAYYDVKQTIR